MYWDLLHGLRQHHIRTTVCKKPTHIPHPLSIHQEWKDLNPVGETGRSLQPDFQSPLKTVWMERSRDLVQHSVPWKGLLWTKLIQLIQGKRPSLSSHIPIQPRWSRTWSHLETAIQPLDCSLFQLFYLLKVHISFLYFRLHVYIMYDGFLPVFYIELMKSGTDLLKCCH